MLERGFCLCGVWVIANQTLKCPAFNTVLQNLRGKEKVLTKLKSQSFMGKMK